MDLACTARQASAAQLDSSQQYLFLLAPSLSCFCALACFLDHASLNPIRLQVVLFGVQGRTLSPYLASTHRFPIPFDWLVPWLLVRLAGGIAFFVLVQSGSLLVRVSVQIALSSQCLDRHLPKHKCLDSYSPKDKWVLSEQRGCLMHTPAHVLPCKAGKQVFPCSWSTALVRSGMLLAQNVIILVIMCHLSFQTAYWNNTIFAHLSSQPLQAFTFNASTMRLYKAAEGNGAFDPTFRNFHAGAVH
jgi:hypothetical protein